MWKIRYGLGGGFGGLGDWETIEAKSYNDALNEAHDRAVELYSSYSGLHGIRSIEDIMEEDGVTEDEANASLEEECESWIDYEAEEIK